MKIRWTVHRSGWTQYEAEVPDDFDLADEDALLELRDHTATRNVDEETTHLTVVDPEVVADGI